MAIAFIHCNSAYAACSADAEPIETKFKKKNAKMSFEITGKPCHDGCSGWVEYDFHYVNGFDVAMSYSNTFQWDSDAGEPVTFTEDIPLTSCTKDDGLCRLVSVDVTDLACHEYDPEF